MTAKKTVELVSADGKRTWSTNDAVEITNLRARGWRNKPTEESESNLVDSDEPANSGRAASPVTTPAADKVAPAKSRK